MRIHYYNPLLPVSLLYPAVGLAIPREQIQAMLQDEYEKHKEVIQKYDDTLKSHNVVSHGVCPPRTTCYDGDVRNSLDLTNTITFFIAERTHIYK